MLPLLYRYLRESTRVVDMVDTRIYRRGIGPDKPQQPYVTWQVISGVPENTLSETPSKDRMTVQIDCWHRDDKGCEVLATAVRDALEDKGHMTGTPVDQRDPETKLWRLALEFDFFVDRPTTEPTS